MPTVATLPRRAVAWALFAAALQGTTSIGAQEPGYKPPPQVVVDILDAPLAPDVWVSPDREWLALVHRKNMPSLSDLSEPMLRLAGRRINPRNNGSFGPELVTGLSVMRIEDGSERALPLPEGEGWGTPSFSPDGRLFTFTRDVDTGVELWVGDVAGARARRLVGPELNGARGAPCLWMPDSGRLLCHLVPERGRPPEAPRVPGTPIVQQTSGETAPVRTYQDLLETPHDEALYEHYVTSVPVLVDVDTGARTVLGAPGLYATFSPSPSGEYFLVERRVRPFSYLVPDYLFPREVEVRGAGGELVAHVASVPLGEGIPIGGVLDGPRGHRWLPGSPHTIQLVSALDGGDPRRRVERRDRVLLLEAPFDGEPRELARTEFRYSGLVPGEGGLALLDEFDRPSRTRRTWRLDLYAPDGAPHLLWERSSEDRYGDPGSPVLRPDDSGARVLLQEGDWIYLTGPGGSDDGDRPFLDRFNVRDGTRERLFRSDADRYETVEAVLAGGGGRVLTRHESRTEPPNWFVRDVVSGGRRALTRFPDPAPQLAGVEKRFLVYRRADGVQLSGDLYLPPEHRPGQRLPTVVWAYPREYADADLAGQVRGSPNRFTRVTGASHLLFLTQGYAVFDGPTMPIVGGDTANDRYVEQLVASAEAAVGQLLEMGVADPERIGVGGHSYGAFMTANLLAHSDLFRAGIARSGAYNRTLTPFGFQSEQRTFWEVPEVYFRMSPFMHADRIDEPLLLIHGVADNNSGTFPVQSERLYHAIRGLGGTARLVMLPHESHGYRARESVLHALAEMLEWFDRYVKEAPGRATDGG